MLKRLITYTDFDGEEHTELFYFNFTKAEVVELEVSKDGSLGDYIQRISREKDVAKIFSVMKELVLKAYGVKSDDGKRFIKSPELMEEFSQSAAFSELFMELCTDAEKAAAFIKAAMPADIDEYLDKLKLTNESHAAAEST